MPRNIADFDVVLKELRSRARHGPASLWINGLLFNSKLDRWFVPWVHHNDAGAIRVLRAYDFPDVLVEAEQLVPHRRPVYEHWFCVLNCLVHRINLVP